MKISKTLGELSIHEAMDRLNIASDMVEMLLADHHEILAIPEVKSRVDKAIRMLEEAYLIFTQTKMPD